MAFSVVCSILYMAIEGALPSQRRGSWIGINLLLLR